MEIKRYVVLLGAILTFLVTLLLFVVFTVLSSEVDPRILGFFCDDKSIRYPFLPRATVPTWSLYIMAFLVPIFVLFCGTLLNIKTLCSCRESNDGANTPQTITVNNNKEGCRPHSCYYSYFIKLGVWFGWYLIGIGLTSIITNVVKMSSGQLRPYFLTVCNPDLSLVNCTDEFGWPVFVTNYSCRGDLSIVREARLSFPSGHASIGSFIFVFSALYISSLEIIHKRSPLQFLFITIIGILMTLLIGLTRVDDYRHHLQDVIVGFALGTLMAFIVVYFSYYFNIQNDNNTDTNNNDVSPATNNEKISAHNKQSLLSSSSSSSGSPQHEKVVETSAVI